MYVIEIFISVNMQFNYQRMHKTPAIKKESKEIRKKQSFKIFLAYRRLESCNTLKKLACIYLFIFWWVFCNKWRCSFIVIFKSIFKNISAYVK